MLTDLVLTGALTKSSIPYVLVQCKCDLQDRPQKMDAVTFEKMSRIISGKELHRTAADSPRTQKRCISILLRSIVLKTPGKQDPVPISPSPNILRTSHQPSSSPPFICPLWSHLSFLIWYTGAVGLHQHRVLRRPAPFMVHRVALFFSGSFPG